jgi:hypothetical protein
MSSCQVRSKGEGGSGLSRPRGGHCQQEEHGRPAQAPSNVSYLFLFAACLVLPWIVGASFPALFLGATACVAAFYALAQREIGGGALAALARAPLLMAVCAGMSAHQSRAVLEALAGRDSAFVRTPKTGGRPARYPRRETEVFAGLANATDETPAHDS